MGPLKWLCFVIAALVLQCLTSNAKEMLHCDCLYFQQKKSRYICLMLENSKAYKDFQKNTGNRYSLLANSVTVVSKCQSDGCSAVARYRDEINICGPVSGKFISLYYSEWSGGYDTHVLTVRPDGDIAAKLSEPPEENYR
jgi:hypothetical protein